MEIEQPESDKDLEYVQVMNKKRKLNIDKVFYTSPTLPQHPNLALKNRFTPLETEKPIQQRESTNIPVNTKPKTPPPIVIHRRVQDYKGLLQFITETVGKQYHIKHAGGRISIHTYKNEHYKALLRELTEANLQFHTYTPSDEKTHGFVLRGLDSEPELEEIKEDLQNTHKIPVQKIYKMNTNFRPLYLIITDKNVNLTFLTENIKFVCNTKIKWELHNNNKKISQCKRCQEWGHATTNCFADPTCAHCAESHWTYQCMKKETIKCSNCQQQGHKSYSTDCPAYIKRLEFITKPEPAKKIFVDAPAPEINAWRRNETSNVPRNNATTSNRSTTTATTRKEDFPALAPTNSSNSNKNTETDTDTTNMTDFQALTNEFKKLNSLVNLEKMLNLVSKLNKQLEKAKSQIEKFIIINNFTSNLTDNDF